MMTWQYDMAIPSSHNNPRILSQIDRYELIPFSWAGVNRVFVRLDNEPMLT